MSNAATSPKVEGRHDPPLVGSPSCGHIGPRRRHHPIWLTVWKGCHLRLMPGVPSLRSKHRPSIVSNSPRIVKRRSLAVRPTKINSSNPALPAVPTSYAAPPFPPFSHPPIELACSRPGSRVHLDRRLDCTAVHVAVLVRIDIHVSGLKINRSSALVPSVWSDLPSALDMIRASSPSSASALDKCCCAPSRSAPSKRTSRVLRPLKTMNLYSLRRCRISPMTHRLIATLPGLETMSIPPTRSYVQACGVRVSRR